ncbi:gas vesicle protein [Roseibacterium sp. SDUM158017]|uniref:gas vesicle protein n=1 Tax=Roseicyclus salinarum TaxID=3036773 RepID=UPI0024152F21|nr:gas vesicle protein [Roseibacterium sp. SDUM158017]MDG4648417.1 gas vesicle protein [Roseibacterium sp. SDUM158017]
MAEGGFDLSFATPSDALSATDGRLVDVVDRLLDAGVVLRGEVWLTVADVDLVFLGVDLVLANPDAIGRSGRPG